MISGGNTTTMTTVDNVGESTKWLKTEWSTNAISGPGRTERFRSDSAFAVTAMIAAVPPCITAVPKPRTTQSAGGASESLVR